MDGGGDLTATIYGLCGGERADQHPAAAGGGHRRSEAAGRAVRAAQRAAARGLSPDRGGMGDGEAPLPGRPDAQRAVRSDLLPTIEGVPAGKEDKKMNYHIVYFVIVA